MICQQPQWMREFAGESVRAVRQWLVCAVAIAALAGCAAAPPRTNEYLQRVELLALLQTINADLLSHDSATLTLERWCADHALGATSASAAAHVVAHRVRDADKPIPAELRARLAIADDEPLHYRHVQLTCRGVVLSEADNWYVPKRLGAGMQSTLETSDVPFGKVVAPLGFQRRTLSAQLLWTPLAPGWESSAQSPVAGAAVAPLRIPHEVLQHRAMLVTADGMPFAALIETYSGDLFSFGRWESLRAARSNEP